MNTKDYIHSIRETNKKVLAAVVHLSEGKVVPSGPLSSTIQWSKVGLRAIQERTHFTEEQVRMCAQSLKEKELVWFSANTLRLK